MGFLENLMGTGMPGELAGIVSARTVDNSPTRTSSGSLTATGTTIADALALVNLVNLVGTAAAGTGVRLPDAPIGQLVVVQNNGANALNVFPPSASGTINGGTAGAAVTTAAAAGFLGIRRSATDWIGYVIAKEA